MPLLTVTNSRTSELAIQDPTGSTPVSFTVLGSATVTRSLSLAQLANLEAQLIAGATASILTWSVSDDPNSSVDTLPAHLQTVLTQPYNAIAGDQIILVNLSVAHATSVVLSAAAPIGQLVTVVDLKGDAGTNNITITVASGTIDGSANLVISTNKNIAQLLKVSTTNWIDFRVAP